MKKERLKELLAKFNSLRIVVCGDLFLDKWVWIDQNIQETSIETGIETWQVAKTKCAPGAAGTVLNTLHTLGVGTLSVISILGRDGDGYEVRKALQERSIDSSGIIEDDRIVTPTYMKPMFTMDGVHGTEGNRLDFKNRTTTPADLEDQLIRQIERIWDETDAIVALDQLPDRNTGVLTDRIRDFLSEMGLRYPDKLLYADSRDYIHLFDHMMIKCNNFEALSLSGRDDHAPFDIDEVFRAQDEIEKKTGHPAIVTCNVHGIAVHEQGEHFLLPAAHQTGKIDIVGAGDACTAGLVAALAAGSSLSEAATIGNLCSGVTVRKIGTTGTADQAEILDLFDEQKDRFGN